MEDLTSAGQADKQDQAKQAASESTVLHDSPSPTYLFALVSTAQEDKIMECQATVRLSTSVLAVEAALANTAGWQGRRSLL